MDGPADARTSTEQRRDDHGQPRSSEAERLARAIGEQPALGRPVDEVLD
jgi:hypothetical protein